jgi:hypothetical protein
MRNIRILLIPALMAALAVATATADARRGGGDDRIEVAGTCTDGSTSKLKAKTDDGRIEAEFEVDQNRSGVRWKVRLRQNGDLVVKTRRTTNERSGSFSLERRLPNRSGTDRIKAFAKSPGGETCRASLDF